MSWLRGKVKGWISRCNEMYFIDGGAADSRITTEHIHSESRNMKRTAGGQKGWTSPISDPSYRSPKLPCTSIPKLIIGARQLKVRQTHTATSKNWVQLDLLLISFYNFRWEKASNGLAR